MNDEQMSQAADDAAAAVEGVVAVYAVSALASAARTAVRRADAPRSRVEGGVLVVSVGVDADAGVEDTAVRVAAAVTRVVGPVGVRVRVSRIARAAEPASADPVS